MRDETLYVHLSITEDALRTERIRIDDQLKLIRTMRLEGRTLSTAKELLRAMTDELYSLERHRALLLEQLSLFVTSPSPTHLGTRRKNPIKTYTRLPRTPRLMRKEMRGTECGTREQKLANTARVSAFSIPHYRWSPVSLVWPQGRGYARRMLVRVRLTIAERP